MNKLQEKVKDYENFIEDTLKRDLQEIESNLNDKVGKFKDWEEVKQVVKMLRKFEEKNTDMLVKVDIGNGILLDGEVTDFRDTYIHIGLGYMLEMDQDEVEKYSDIRLKLLKKEIDHLRKLAVDVKVHIKFTLLGINELQASLVSS